MIRWSLGRGSGEIDFAMQNGLCRRCLALWRVEEGQATGNVGRAAVEGILSHPQLELAGAWVHSADKAGRDVGDLCGLSPIGVKATCNVEEILALHADCVLYSPLFPQLDEVVRLLDMMKLGERYYDRLPGKAEGVVRPPVWGLSRDSAGTPAPAGSGRVSPGAASRTAARTGQGSAPSTTADGFTAADAPVKRCTPTAFGPRNSLKLRVLSPPPSLTRTCRLPLQTGGDDAGLLAAQYMHSPPAGAKGGSIVPSQSRSMLSLNVVTISSVQFPVAHGVTTSLEVTSQGLFVVTSSGTQVARMAGEYPTAFGRWLSAADFYQNKIR